MNIADLIMPYINQQDKFLFRLSLSFPLIPFHLALLIPTFFKVGAYLCSRSPGSARAGGTSGMAAASGRTCSGTREIDPLPLSVTKKQNYNNDYFFIVILLLNELPVDGYHQIHTQFGPCPKIPT